MAQEQSFSGRLLKPFVSDTALGLLSLVILVCLGLGTFFLWKRYGPKVTKHPSKVLEPTDLKITQTPRWIKTDIKTDTMTRWSLDHRNVFDNEVPKEVGRAFEAHPWVRKVKYAAFKYPDSIVVDVDYRRPVAFVEIEAGILERYPEGGLLPIDDEGCHLPIEDFTSDDTLNYPIVKASGTFPQKTEPGTLWGDARISGAARIAEALGRHWNDIQLDWIEAPASTQVENAIPESGAFVIYAKNGLPIIWGRPPGEEKAGEMKAEDKIARLLKIVAQRGPLDVTDHQTQMEETIDLRTAELAAAIR